MNYLLLICSICIYSFIHQNKREAQGFRLTKNVENLARISVFRLAASKKICFYFHFEKGKPEIHLSLQSIALPFVEIEIYLSKAHTKKCTYRFA